MSNRTKKWWARHGFVDHECCIHYEEYAFPREGDFDSWCEKRNKHIKNIHVEHGCKYFDQ